MDVPSPFVLLAEHSAGGMRLQYRQDADTGLVGLRLLPQQAMAEPVVPRIYIDDAPETVHLPPRMNRRRARLTHSLVQAKLRDDPAPGAHAHGATMAHGLSVAALTFRNQTVRHREDGGEIITNLERPGILRAAHRLRWSNTLPCLVVTVEIENLASEPIEVELLASFCLDDLTPYAIDDAPERLWLHRFRSDWSAEGRLESRLVEELHLERSWLGTSPRNLRWGPVGSLPTRSFFPTAVVEDRTAGVCWGAQIAWHGSWQFELYRLGDSLALSGGLADFEHGHWSRRLAPGDVLLSPPALITCASGNVDDTCQQLTAGHDLLRTAPLPAPEADLPIVFNEWSTTWGEPSAATLTPILDRLTDSPVRYFVIDAGWYRPASGAPWNNAQGDWEPNPTLFPHGLGAFAANIRARGLVPGLWFEFECVGRHSRKFSDTALCLHRHGRVITAGGRRFLDFRQPATHAYLSSKVIDRLRDDRFGYLKIDYNDNIGTGVDNADGDLGEGLRQHLLGVHRFLQEIHAQIPDLVIENCSSGGYRLEPGSMAQVAMGSFSDAHELWEIPVIAANLHRLIQPRQSQIWVVLHPGDSADRLDYSLTAGFLGRLCLSGEIDQLSTAQWDRTREALELYRRAVPCIRAGRSVIRQRISHSYRHLRGWQAVLRTSPDNTEALAVAHAFGGPAPGRIELDLPGHWRVLESWGAEVDWNAPSDRLQLQLPRPYIGAVARLGKM
jgi:alpha-galactosidase